MPYRNALRDNWRRYQDTLDSEARQYARDFMMQAQPVGMYAAAEPLSLSDIGYDENGNMIILSDRTNPNVYQGRRAMPPAPTAQQSAPNNYNFNPEEGLNAIQERRRALAEALNQY